MAPAPPRHPRSRAGCPEPPPTRVDSSSGPRVSQGSPSTCRPGPHGPILTRDPSWQRGTSGRAADRWEPPASARHPDPARRVRQEPGRRVPACVLCGEGPGLPTGTLSGHTPPSPQTEDLTSRSGLSSGIGQRPGESGCPARPPASLRSSPFAHGQVSGRAAPVCTHRTPGGTSLTCAHLSPAPGPPCGLSPESPHQSQSPPPA